MSQRLVVRTVCTATLVEEWTIEVPDDADVDRLTWTTGWAAAHEAGITTVLAVENISIDEERDRIVIDVRELPILKEAG